MGGNQFIIATSISSTTACTSRKPQSFRKTESGALNYTRATFKTSTDFILFNDFEHIRTWNCQRKKGREPAMPPPTISHPATTKPPTTLHGSPQQLPTHLRQPSSKPSERMSTSTTNSHENIIQSDPVQFCRYRDLPKIKSTALSNNQYRRRYLST
jgi:hypothetical protein